MTIVVKNRQLSSEYINKLNTLTPNEKFVIIYYFGIGKEKLSLSEIAELKRKPGVNTNQIRDTLFKALDKLNNEASTARTLRTG